MADNTGSLSLGGLTPFLTGTPFLQAAGAANTNAAPAGSMASGAPTQAVSPLAQQAAIGITPTPVASPPAPGNSSSSGNLWDQLGVTGQGTAAAQGAGNGIMSLLQQLLNGGSSFASFGE